LSVDVPHVHENYPDANKLKDGGESISNVDIFVQLFVEEAVAKFLLRWHDVDVIVMM